MGLSNNGNYGPVLKGSTHTDGHSTLRFMLGFPDLRELLVRDSAELFLMMILPGNLKP